MTKTVGFIGIGMFALYTVRGLRNGGQSYPIVLSPRGAENAKQLASECNCKIMQSNQDVIDNSDIVVISVRPEQFRQMAEALTVPAGKIIISAIAGISLSELKSSLNGADKVYRTLPVCCSEAGAGLVPVYPSDNEQVNGLLKPLGNVVAMKSEDDFTGASIGACMNGSLYELYAVMVKWFESKGFDKDTARAIVLDNVAGTVAYAKMKNDTELTDICDSIATDGTYTKIGYNTLDTAGGFSAWVDCLNVLDDKFKGTD